MKKAAVDIQLRIDERHECCSDLTLDVSDLYGDGNLAHYLAAAGRAHEGCTYSLRTTRNLLSFLILQRTVYGANLSLLHSNTQN
jgi:hypothetical protein